MIRAAWNRLRFALRYRTFRPVTRDPRNEKKILVCHGGAVTALPRRCPHQGAPMEKARLKRGKLHCPWHGCYFELEGGRFCPKSFAEQKQG